MEAFNFNELYEVLLRLLEKVDAMEEMLLTSQLDRSAALVRIEQKLDDIHTIQTGKLYRTKERKPTKKERESAELESLRRDAHIRVLNR